MVGSSAARLRCVIAGAGLGGLAAAIALRRAGHEVVVLEQADALGTVGAGIQMAPNASRLLGAWGVVDRFRDAGVPAQAAVRRRWDDGTVLGEVILGDKLLERFGASYWCLHRADLHAALVGVATDAEGPGSPVEIRLGAPVTGVAVNGAGEARLVTADGTEVAGDVAIGADGIRSAVRSSLFGEQPPSFSGRVTNRHVLDVADLQDDPLLAPILDRPAQNIWIGPGGHVLTHPIRGGAGIYMGVTTSGLSGDDAFWSTPVSQADMLAAREGWDPRVLHLIRAAPVITAYGLHDAEPMQRWIDGRVALLGDACHAMMPFQAQGAAQAIEDGAVLGETLAGVSPHEVAAALARYEARRKPRASRVQALSRANGKTWHVPDGPEQRARDAALASGDSDFRAYEFLWSVGPEGAPAPAEAVAVA
jgi:salicylate hydroxylase